MAKLNYPVDYTGAAATNLIVDELKSVQPPANLNEASFVVPRAAPFYSKSLEIYTAKDKKGTKLVEGRDYFLVYKFVAGTNVTGQPLAGGICFTNSLYSGNIYITYQTLGGDFTVDDVTLLEQTVRKLYSNILFVRWDQIDGVPSAFPSDAHKHPVTEECTFGDISARLELIASALTYDASGSEGSASALIRSHMSASSGAHTPSAVGLGNVPNYPVADEEDASTSRADRLMTPNITAYMIRRSISSLEIGNITDDIESIQDRINAVETTVKQLTMVVLSISTAVDDLNNALNLYRQEIATLAAKIDEVNESAIYASVVAAQALAQAAATEQNLEQISVEINEVLYTGNIVLTAGNHLVTIPAGQAQLISLIGAGGGSGKWYQTSGLAAQYGGSLTDGEDSVLYFLGTSSVAVEPLPLLVAGGGRAGINTYAEIGAATAGNGGKCKRFRSERVKVSDLATADITTDYVDGPAETNGVAGRNGDTSNTAASVTGNGGWGIMASGTGITRFYGQGANGVTKASTGGSGGRWEITIHNDTKEPVRIAISVGKSGKSSRSIVNEETTTVLTKSISNGAAVVAIVA